MQNKESFKELEDLLVVLFEIFLEIFIQIVSERYNTEISYATQNQIFEYKIINKLSVASYTWSDLIKSLFNNEVIEFLNDFFSQKLF